MSQKQLIVNYLQSLNGEWVRAYDLRGKNTKFGFLGHQADRRARELAADGKVEHRIKDKFSEYRWVPLGYNQYGYPSLPPAYPLPKDMKIARDIKLL